MTHEANPGHLPSIEEVAASGEGDFEDHYPLSASGEIFDEFSDEVYDYYAGKNVIWIGAEGRMLQVDPEYVLHLDGNIFYPDKLASVVSGVKDATERVGFVAPYGTVSFIDPDDIKESVEYADDTGFEAYTAGDDDLDAFIVDPGAAIEERAEMEDISPAAAKSYFETELAAAVEAKDGDLGAMVVTIRDGNHRAFGSLVAGEPHVWVILADNDYQDIKEGKPWVDPRVVAALQ